MNIKRAFIALGAILFSGFLAGFSQQAQATPHYTPASPDCIAWNVASTSWPTGPTGDVHYFICDGSYQNFLNPSIISITMRDHVLAKHSAVVRSKLAAAHVGLFLFAEDWQYNQYPHTHISNFLEHGWSGTAPSLSGPTGAHPWPAIVILESYCLNPPTGCTNSDYSFNQKLVNHEIGHAIDMTQGSPSQSSSFTTRLDQDIIDFNLLTNINWGGIPATCTQTVNFDKLKCWLAIPTTYTTAEVRAEFFAECYASTKFGGTHPAGASTIVANYFRTGGPMAPSSRQRSCSYANDFAETP